MQRRPFADMLRVATALLALLLAVGSPAPSAAQGGIRRVQGWEDLNPEQRRRALENYERYQKLPKDQQREIDQSWKRWRGMDSQEKSRVRQNYESYRQLDKQQRKDFDERYRQWRRSGEDR